MGCACNSDTVQHYALPDGAAGTRETLKHMRELTRRGVLDPDVRDIAQQIVRAYGVPAKFWLGEIAAIFEFVRAQIRYSLDPNQVELVQDAKTTLELGYGDCDDLCVCIATLLEQLGHVCYFMAMGFEPRWEFSHVIVIVNGAAGETGPIALDATEPEPMGWCPPGARCLMVAEIGEAG